MNQRGASIVEMVVSVPLVMLTLLFFIGFTFQVQDKLLSHYAMFMGVRAGAVQSQRALQIARTQMLSIHPRAAQHQQLQEPLALAHVPQPQAAARTYGDNPRP